MKKYLPIISVAIISLATPQSAHAAFDLIGIALDSLTAIPGNIIAYAILPLASWLTWLAAIALNYSVIEFVVKMSEKTNDLSAINTAWRTIRDLANMTFIFILLYAAINTIVGREKNTREIIVRVIVVAVLINFSLFFTRVVIDSSNVLAITFYDAIAPGEKGMELNHGLSSSLMEPLKIQSIWEAKNLKMSDGTSMLAIGVLGVILSIVAAFVFFAVALLLIIRFVILVLLMALAPLAIIGFALPQAKTYADQWVSTLINQAFFAPIYFLLTWLAIILSRGLVDDNGNIATALVGVAGQTGGKLADPSSINIIVNFALVIILIIASLVISKGMASKVPGVGGKLVSAALGFAGGATLGLAARAGRNTIGAGASRLAQSESFQRYAGRSIVGQTLFKGTQKAAGSSFDFRATRAGGATLGELGAGQAKTGGYEARLQEKMAAKEKTAQSLRSPQAKEAYAARISRGPITQGGTRNSRNTIMGTLGRHNRVAASKILNGQLGPLETQEQSLQNRETQLNQQLANMTNELATLNAIPVGTRTAQQNARITALNDVTVAGVPPIPANRNSIAYVQHHLTQTQTNLTRVTTETARIRGIITANQLNNPANPVVNPATGAARPARADEQNY